MVKKKKTGGRTTKLTPEVLEKIVAAIRAGNYAVVAAAFAGISERTYYRWMHRGREEKKGIYWQFCQAVEKAESEAEVRAVAIIQKHMETNWQAAMTYLERKYPDRWARRTRVEFKAPEDPMETIGVLLGFTEEQMEEMKKEADEDE